MSTKKYYECYAHFNTSTNLWDCVIYKHSHPENILCAQFSAKSKQELEQMIDEWQHEQSEMLDKQHRALTDDFKGRALEMTHPIMQARGQLHTLNSKKLIVR